MKLSQWLNLLNEAKRERAQKERDDSREKRKKTFNEYKHNQRANGRRTDTNLERNKFNSTPRKQ